MLYKDAKTIIKVSAVEVKAIDTVAAGYCVSKYGASNSMIDYVTLQRTINQTHINVD